MGKVYTFATKYTEMPTGNTYHVELQATLGHQLLALCTDLLYQATPYRTHTADKEIEHLIFRKEKRVVYDIECLAQVVLADNKRDVRLAGALCCSNHVDTVSPQHTKKLSRKSWIPLHVLAHDSHRSQAVDDTHRIHLTHGYLLGKLTVKHSRSQASILVADANGGAAFRRCLSNKKHADAILCQSTEDTLVDTDNTNHAQACDVDKRSSRNAGDTLNDAPRVV